MADATWSRVQRNGRTTPIAHAVYGTRAGTLATCCAASGYTADALHPGAWAHKCRKCEDAVARSGWLLDVLAVRNDLADRGVDTSEVKNG